MRKQERFGMSARVQTISTILLQRELLKQWFWGFSTAWTGGSNDMSTVQSSYLFSGDQESKTSEMKITSGMTLSKKQSMARHQDISPSRLCDLWMGFDRQRKRTHFCSLRILNPLFNGWLNPRIVREWNTGSKMDEVRSSISSWMQYWRSLDCLGHAQAVKSPSRYLYRFLIKAIYNQSKPIDKFHDREP